MVEGGTSEACCYPFLPHFGNGSIREERGGWSEVWGGVGCDFRWYKGWLSWCNEVVILVVYGGELITKRDREA